MYITMADFEQLQDEVLQKLPLLNIGQLEECCVQLAIEIPAPKKGKKTGTRSLLLNHLSTEAFEEQTDATEVLQKMLEDLNKMLAENVDDKMLEKKAGPEVKVEEANVNVVSVGEGEQNKSTTGAHSGTTTTKIELARFKDWKVNPGTFGGETHVDYCSLCYQIEEAKDLRYSEKEIVSGMIKAMKNPLRKYCEGKMSWSLEALMKRIRSYAKVQDADKLMDNMKARSQESNQTEIEFLTQMCTLRDNILAMTPTFVGIGKVLTHSML